MNKLLFLITTLLLLLVNQLLGQQVILHDDFNDNSNKWQEGQTAVSNVKVDTRRRMYQVQHKSKDSRSAWTAWTELEINEQKNFSITALLYKETGVKNYGYGLLWGGREDNYYSFLVSPGGFYSIGKVVDGKWQNLSNDGWIKCAAVSRGNTAFNKLQISKLGDTYHFSVNDQKVATMKCGTFFGNRIGFNVNNKQKIMVDWIKVEYLN